MNQLLTPFAGIAVFIMLLGILPIACSNKLTLSSLSETSVNTNGANICEENPTPTPGIPPNGINWASATVQLQSSGGFSVSIPLSGQWNRNHKCRGHLFGARINRPRSLLWHHGFFRNNLRGLCLWKSERQPNSGILLYPYDDNHYRNRLGLISRTQNTHP